MSQRLCEKIVSSRLERGLTEFPAFLFSPFIKRFQTTLHTASKSCEFLFYAHKAAAPILLALLLLLNDSCIITIVEHRLVAGCLAKVNKL
jgi:hypothetical protein